MDTVILHPLRFQVDLLHKKRHQRHAVLLRQFGVDRRKRLGVAAAIVGRQAHLHQQRFGFRRFDLANHLVQRLLQLLRWKTAQAVVAAQLDQYPARLVLLQQRGQPRQPLRRGITTYATVNHGRGFLPLIIQQRRPRGTGRHPVTGAQAVTEHQQGICRRRTQRHQRY